MTSAVRSTTSSRRSLSALATCTSLSQAINSIDNSKPAVILDLGRRLTKVGFAGEYVPRAIIHSHFLEESIYDEKKPQDNGECQSFDPFLSVMVKFFRSIFSSNLLTMPRERRVVIVESMLTPTRLRELICEALLEILSVPSVLFIPSHLAATFPFNTDYALVVDVGYTETVAVPIAEGVTMLSCWEVSNVGARKVEDRVRKLLKEHGRVETCEGVTELNDEHWKLIEEASIVEDICVRYMFCSPIERGHVLQEKGSDHNLPPIKSLKIPLGADFLSIPGFVREAACEILFDRCNDETSLPMLIHSIVERCPLDLRRKMFESILITGGTSLIPGFLSRLKAELLEEAKSSPSKVKQCESISFYRFTSQSAEVYLPWLGGSLFGALQDAVRLRSLSRETWIEERNIPDWTDYVCKGIPCGKPELER